MNQISKSLVLIMILSNLAQSKQSPSVDNRKFQVTLNATQIEFLLKSGILQPTDKVIVKTPSIQGIDDNQLTEFDTHEVFEPTEMAGNHGGNW